MIERFESSQTAILGHVH